MQSRIFSANLAVFLLGSCTVSDEEHGVIQSEMYRSVSPSLPLIMNHPIGTDTLTMRSEPMFAGAISSMTFRGQEYINSADHGRLMQGAIAYNDRFECLNPTQAGGSRDRENLGQRSTSQRLISYVTRENSVHVTTRMAYWLRPGMKCAIPYVGRQNVDNKTRLSADTYKIAYSFGLNGHPNVASLDIEYDIKAAYRTAVVEALTIYTPLAFDNFHSVDPKTGAMVLQPMAEPEETAAPTILSTLNGTHAIAFVSLIPNASYARFRFADTNKISLVYRDLDGITGVNRYSAAMVIGTRDEVATQVRAILTNQREFGFAGVR